MNGVHLGGHNSWFAPLDDIYLSIWQCDITNAFKLRPLPINSRGPAKPIGGDVAPQPPR